MEIGNVLLTPLSLLIVVSVLRLMWNKAYQKGSSDRYNFFVEKWGKDWISRVDSEMEKSN